MTLLSPIENGSAHQSGARLSRRALGFALALLLALPLGAPARAFADVRGTDEILGASVEARGLPAVACPNITATFALVMDDEGTVLFSRGALERSHIASITKIMTAIVALDSGVPLDSTVTVSQEAASVGESSASLWAGDTLTLEAALAGLMIPSGNDAAIAIAETLGEGMKTDDSQTANEAFVAAMNAKAAELGMTETLFSNPHGLDIGAYDNEMYSCARDVALMSAYAMGNETFRSIVSKESAQITVTRADGKPQVIDLQSTDRLLGTYEGACGIKTGYTEAAGNSFAGACDRGDGLLYAIVLGSPSEDARFQDTETLFNWVYDNRVSYALAHSPETVASAADGGAEVPLIARVSHSAWPDRTVAATFADPSAAVEVFAPEGNVSQEIVAEELTGSVAAGDVVGVANFYQGNELVASQDLIACEDSPAPGFLEGIGIWWNRLWGNDAPAPTEVVNETPLIYSKSSSREDHQSVAAIAAGVSDDAPAKRRGRGRRRRRQRVRRWAMSERCPVCSHEISPNDTVCPTCGFKLLGATQAMQPLVMSETPATTVEESAPARATLNVVRGPQVGISFVLTGEPVTIGRSPQCTIFLNDMTVSRMHATIEQENGCYVIRDANSFNGVWVNNDSVEARALRPGDFIQIGTFCMQYEEN